MLICPSSKDACNPGAPAPLSATVSVKDVDGALPLSGTRVYHSQERTVGTQRGAEALARRAVLGVRTAVSVQGFVPVRQNTCTPLTPRNFESPMLLTSTSPPLTATAAANWPPERGAVVAPGVKASSGLVWADNKNSGEANNTLVVARRIGIRSPDIRTLGQNNREPSCHQRLRSPFRFGLHFRQQLIETRAIEARDRPT